MTDSFMTKEHVDQFLDEYDNGDAVSIMNLRIMRSIKTSSLFAELPNEFRDQINYIDEELNKRGDNEVIKTLDDIERNITPLTDEIDRLQQSLNTKLLSDQDSITTLRKIKNLSNGVTFTEGIDKEKYPNIYKVQASLDTAMSLLNAN